MIGRLLRRTREEVEEARAVYRDALRELVTAMRADLPPRRGEGEHE